MTEAEIWQVVYLSRFHDIGKQTLPIGILKKHGKSTLEERRIFQLHPILAVQILRSNPKLREYPYYSTLYDICLHHHERWDGGGYPDGLKERHITPYVHVVGLTDAYDDLRTARPYKRAFTHEEAMSMICSGECGVFDPNMIDCLQELPEAVFSACYGKERKIG